MSNLKISIIVPAKNEADNLPSLLREIESSVPSDCSEIIVIDDGSHDKTSDVVSALIPTLGLPCTLLYHKESCGQSTSVYHGVQAAKGNWVITLDADGQNDPSDIPNLLAVAATCKAHHFCIIGHRQQRQDSTWKRIQSKIANSVRQWVLGDNTPDTGCGLKLIPRTTFNHLPYFDHMHRYTPALVKRIGGIVISVPVNHRPRRQGSSNYTAWNRGWAGIIDMLGVRWLMYRNRNDAVWEKETREG